MDHFPDASGADLGSLKDALPLEMPGVLGGGQPPPVRMKFPWCAVKPNDRQCEYPGGAIVATRNGVCCMLLEAAVLPQIGGWGS